MIIMTTGLPGAGKTLRMVQEVKAQAEKENRPVFYAGLEILDEVYLPWTKLDNEAEWFNCPKGAIIVIDECQRLFRPRANGSAVPKCVSELETHRHMGVDLWITTQHPLLIDGNVRRLVGRHFHVNRTFNMRRAVVHEWNKCRDNCDKSTKDSVRHDWSYPKVLFGKYKSTELDTYKARIPMKFWLFCLLPIALAVLGFMAYRWFANFDHKFAPGSTPTAEASAPQSHGKAISSASRDDRRNEHRTLEQWVQDQQPRIAGLPHTAPEYDDLTKPQSVPAPQACVSSAKGCKCYTDQGTPVQMDKDMCENIVRNGIYLPWKPGQQPMQNTTTTPVQVSSQPPAPVETKVTTLKVSA
ncbi:zonular occludens toxin domain-containing protein [Jeongeupia chitinilytica]|uniref:Zona occludens toxin N-terminal domain-containing protein n=1 Tax=Jeongeupia chitinilytica TaxID=1041641 RepID=A0ABQ3GY32_9NEIS|nr:zonular occludens toxin domain-containing protein [Jeongeupia chitinilytica]GHD60772.1 hypothetical protein GCM10007350_14320 [Jeongeupia chitinilytica]